MRKWDGSRAIFSLGLVAATAIAGTGASLQASAQEYYEAPTAPPPPPGYYSVPAPRAGYEWAPGYWRWHHGRYVWIGGHWEGVRIGHHWVPAHWVARPRGWRFIPGHWG